MARPLAELTPRQRMIFVAAFGLYTAFVIPVGLHQGRDLLQELPLSERLLAGLPLYTENPRLGIHWTPFTILALSPLALLGGLSLPLAKAAFAVVSVACLAWTVARIGGLWGWRPAILAVLAVAKPVHGNFVWQNIVMLVLACVVAGAADLAEGRERRAGVWLGVATALKAFPGLLLLYLAYRRRWTGFAVGIAVAGGLTLLPGLRYGPLGAVTTAWDWFTVSRNAELLHELTHQPAGGLLLELGAPTFTVFALAFLCFGLVLVAVHRWPAGEERPYGLGLTALLAVLFTPIGWNYNFSLAIPAWVTALTLPAPEHGKRLWVAALVAAGILLSGLLTFHRHYNNVGGALLLMGALAARSLTLRRQPAPVAGG